MRILHICFYLSICASRIGCSDRKSETRISDPVRQIRGSRRVCVPHTTHARLNIIIGQHNSMRSILFLTRHTTIHIRLPIHTMASRQQRRAPHNIFTEKRAEREFQDFVQHARSRKLPIPENLLTQATNNNSPTSSKRQRLTLREVRPSKLLQLRSLVIYNSISLAYLEPIGCKHCANA